MNNEIQRSEWHTTNTVYTRESHHEMERVSPSERQADHHLTHALWRVALAFIGKEPTITQVEGSCYSPHTHTRLWQWCTTNTNLGFNKVLNRAQPQLQVHWNRFRSSLCVIIIKVEPSAGTYPRQVPSNSPSTIAQERFPNFRGGVTQARLGPQDQRDHY